MTTTAAMRANKRRAEVIANDLIREYGPAGENIDYRRALVLAAARALNSENARRDRESGEAARREMAIYRREARMEIARAAALAGMEAAR